MIPTAFQNAQDMNAAFSFYKLSVLPLVIIDLIVFNVTLNQQCKYTNNCHVMYILA